MLTKPDLKDEKIIACLQEHYGLDVAEISFLPLGADFNTAVSLFEYDNGLKVEVHQDMITEPPSRNLLIVGSKATLFWDLRTDNVCTYNREHKSYEEIYAPKSNNKFAAVSLAIISSLSFIKRSCSCNIRTNFERSIWLQSIIA